MIATAGLVVLTAQVSASRTFLYNQGLSWSETMTRGKTETSAQPALAELMGRYLSRQAGAHAAGLATFDPTGEVVPFEAGPVQPVDPRPAWEEAVAVLPFFRSTGAKTSEGEALTPPPQWANLVAAHEPAVALAFCVGNYPQLLRNLHLILHRTKLTDLQPRETQAVVVAELTNRAKDAAANNSFPQTLLALGTLRLARQFDEAGAFLTAHDANVPVDWRDAWANEKAALAWHRGHGAEALALWQAQQPTAPVLFNRGMALLFLGRSADARAPLTQAVAQLPEAGAWHHLARLYLAMAR
jgi:tetratricopeptide (TPR) repeat protein